MSGSPNCLNCSCVDPQSRLNYRDGAISIKDDAVGMNPYFNNGDNVALGLRPYDEGAEDAAVSMSPSVENAQDDAVCHRPYVERVEENGDTLGPRFHCLRTDQLQVAVDKLARLLQLVLFVVFLVIFVTIDKAERRTISIRDSAIMTNKAHTPQNDTNGPHTIYIIRHAEKSDSGMDLSERGWRRAKYLKSLWSGNGSRFMRPKSLFANGGHSRNSYHTLLPLSQALGVPCSEKFNWKKNKAAAEAARKSLSPTLIAWEHKNIFNLTISLLEDDEAMRWLPSPPWGGYQYDMIFILTLNPDGTVAATYDWEMFSHWAHIVA
eukprot:GEMP01057744.1.p1 GENE.GEMP01057744.1~~GEMP01057744.1.p1  ORF type:complete len:321 (+),score=51.57 GEMP01057744.1:102-1064(+)